LAYLLCGLLPSIEYPSLADDGTDIDINNQLKQRTNDNTSALWQDGPLNKITRTAMNSDQVGMQACWYGSDYGDSDYAHTFVPSSGSGAANAQDYGMSGLLNPSPAKAELRLL
jgi:hypothetical protein